MQVSVDKLPIDVPAVVSQICCGKEFKKRLEDFGLVPGTKITARYRSPDGGVVALEFRGTVIAIRICDLKGVRVKWD